VSGSAGKPPVERCRDGVVDPGEECDAGEGPYAQPAIELRTNGIVIELAPVVGSVDVYEAYSYSNHSSHTGKENVSGSKLYFYRPYYESQAYLFTHHGIDFLTTGFVQPAGQVHFEITGLPSGSYLAVSDDPGEVVMDSPSTVLADWTFEFNTAGLALGGIPFPGSWHIVVKPKFLEGIDTFTALSGDGYRTGLSLVRDVELIASDEPGGCRRDCTLPRCGDGRLDAGETCDDGNDEDFDGCSECEVDGFPIPPP
jgi:cysteine-rich repeat protein